MMIPQHTKSNFSASIISNSTTSRPVSYSYCDTENASILNKLLKTAPAPPSYYCANSAYYSSWQRSRSPLVNTSRNSSPASSTRSLTPLRRSTRPLSIDSIASIDSIDSIMSSENLPDTPELSRCSSAKSSSFRSMPSQEDMTDIANFEDISLSDNVSSYVSKPRPTLRSVQTTTATPRRSSSSTNLYNHGLGLRITASNNHARSRNSWQHDVQSSSPVISPYTYGRRTPSPAKSPIVSSSPRSAGSTPRFGNENSPIFPSRPLSWQQKPRKSQKELENDFHDSDDELPEDSFLFNIPLSPRPLHERSPTAIPMPRHPSAHRLSRTSSWQAAMADLTEDTRKLTSALEVHSDTILESDAEASSNSSTPTSSRPAIVHRAKTVAVLPPLQKPNPLIDPLPCSKEKEQVLSRTRPSWLPPKCQKEEKKHIKEYQKMMSKYAIQAV